MSGIKSLTTVSAFKAMLGVSELTFYKSEGKRAYCPTDAGTLFMAAGYEAGVERGETAFIFVADDTVETKGGESLAGTLWLATSKADVYKTI